MQLRNVFAVAGGAGLRPELRVNSDNSDHQDKVERVLKDLAACASSGADEAFLRQCVRDLGEVYGSQAAFVGVYATEAHDKIRTLARWSKQRGFVDNHVYDLAGTPCKDILDQTLELISCGVAELYAEDEALAQAGLKSYCGVPLVTSSGEVLGLISVVDSDPIPEFHIARPLHHVLANRISHEMEREQWSRALRSSKDRYRRLIEGLRSSFVYAMDSTGKITYASPSVEQLFGFSAEEFAEKRSRLFEDSPINASALEHARGTLRGEQQPRYEASVRLADGSTRFVLVSEHPILDDSGAVRAIEGMVTDITARKRAEAQAQVRSEVLENIAGNASLEKVLALLCRLVEAQRAGSTACVMVLTDDGQTVYTAAAPSPPEEFRKILNRLPFDRVSGVSGASADPHEGVLVTDITTDPQWADALDVAERLGIRGTWSHPVRSETNRLLGTFIISFPDPTEPEPYERDLMKMASQTAAIAIQKDRSAKALAHSEARFRDFAAIAADYLWEIDADLNFSFVSDRYGEITGLDPAGLVGVAYLDLVVGQSAESELWSRHLPALRTKDAFDIEFPWVRPDGTTIVLNHRGHPILDPAGVFRGYRGTGSDVTNAYQLSEQLAYQASHDTLTGLVNRNEFESRLGRALDSAHLDDAEHALCYLDLDQFKIVNDTCGHVAGDELLRQLAQVLRARVRRQDTLARLGGDEFGVLMERCPVEHAQSVADTLRQSVEDFRFHWEGKVFAVGVSIGLVPIVQSSHDASTVLRAADTACYAAKDEGRNRVHVFHEKDSEVVRRQGEMRWVSRIQSALADDRFRIYAQRIQPIAAHNSEGQHYELLLRMVDTEGRLVLPGQFLPAAERYNAATRLDRWVITAAREWFQTHPRELASLGLCSINLSGQSLGDQRFLQFVMDQFSDGLLPPERFCFEVTETAAIGDLTRATAFINTLRRMGCQFSLDDFGSGLSSFAYLKTLAVDYLKIDGVFVRDIVTNSIDLAMVRSINEIGHVMGKKTVAEFVENAEILTKLSEIGVDYAQGYHIAKAIPLEDYALDRLSSPSVQAGPYLS